MERQVWVEVCQYREPVEFCALCKEILYSKDRLKKQYKILCMDDVYK